MKPPSALPLPLSHFTVSHDTAAQAQAQQLTNQERAGRALATGSQRGCAGSALYETQAAFIPQFPMVMCCNDLPEPTNNSIWWRRRMSIIPFNSLFGFDRDNKPLEEEPVQHVAEAPWAQEDRP
jgi:hypothetical protein